MEETPSLVPEVLPLPLWQRQAKRRVTAPERPPEPMSERDALIRDALTGGRYRPSFPSGEPTERQALAHEAQRAARRSLRAAWPEAGWRQTPAGPERDPALLYSVVLTDHEMKARQARVAELRAEANASATQ